MSRFTNSPSRNAADNVVQTVDPSGNDVDDTYDALNRRTARTVTLVSSFLDTTAGSFTYDTGSLRRRTTTTGWSSSTR